MSVVRLLVNIGFGRFLKLFNLLKVFFSYFKLFYLLGNVANDMFK